MVSFLFCLFLFSCYHILQVHNAVGRTVEALENWLHLQPFQLPRLLLFLCSLWLLPSTCEPRYVDKKGVFELAGEKS